MNFREYIAELNVRLVDGHPKTGAYSSDAMTAAKQLNARNIDEVPSGEHRVTELGIMLAFTNPVDGETLLQKLEAASAQDPVLARTLKWTKPGAPGIDLASPTVRAYLALLESNGVITAIERDTVLAIPEQTVSVADQLGRVVRPGHVVEART